MPMLPLPDRSPPITPTDQQPNNAFPNSCRRNTTKLQRFDKVEFRRNEDQRRINVATDVDSLSDCYVATTLCFFAYVATLFRRWLNVSLPTGYAYSIYIYMYIYRHLYMTMKKLQTAVRYFLCQEKLLNIPIDI